MNKPKYETLPTKNQGGKVWVCIHVLLVVSEDSTFAWSAWELWRIVKEEEEAFIERRDRSWEKTELLGRTQSSHWEAWEDLPGWHWPSFGLKTHNTTKGIFLLSSNFEVSFTCLHKGCSISTYRCAHLRLVLDLSFSRSVWMIAIAIEKGRERRTTSRTALTQTSDMSVRLLRQSNFQMHTSHKNEVWHKK